MENLIAHLFLAGEIARREHLRVTGVGSDARHRALADFYDAIVGHGDKLAESYFAYAYCYGLEPLGEIPMLVNATDGNILDVLKAHVLWIKANRYAVVPQDETPIQNMIDSAVETYYHAIYRLSRLA